MMVEIWKGMQDLPFTVQRDLGYFRHHDFCVAVEESKATYVYIDQFSPRLIPFVNSLSIMPLFIHQSIIALPNFTLSAYCNTRPVISSIIIVSSNSILARTRQWKELCRFWFQRGMAFATTFPMMKYRSL